MNIETFMHGTGGDRNRVRQKPRAWWLMTLLAALIALYGLAYVVLGERMFVRELADSFRARSLGLYLHAFFAAIALATGPLQFHRGLLIRRRAWHRNSGKVYIVAALIGGGFAGLYMAAYSYGGWITHLGFGALAVLTALTTLVAYFKIKARQVNAHREWMIRSYALIFAAVTLRLWLPLLIIINDGSFAPAYLWVSWLSWVPNLMLAELHIRRSKSKLLKTVVAPR